MKNPRIALLLGLALSSIPVFADQNLAGNVTITGGTSTGNLNVTGAIDSDSNTFTFGTQGTSYGGAMLYADSSTDTLKFLINRNPASWAWVHNTSINAMRLDSAHQLILYKADGTTAGLTFTPVSNAISFGTAATTITADTTAGTLSVAGGFINTTGAFTGGATGLTLNAGGTNQNITLTPSGTGSTILNGNVGIGVAPSGYYRLEVLGVPKFFPAAGGNNYVLLGAGGQSTGGSGVVLGYNQTYNGVAMTNSAYIQAESQGSAYRNLLLSPLGGNVGIGTTNPGARLESYAPSAEAIRIRGDSSYLAIFNTAGTRQGYLQGGTVGNIVLASDAGVVAFNANGSERMRIDTAGLVGIGTSNPVAKLHVKSGGLRLEGNTSTSWLDTSIYTVDTASGGRSFAFGSRAGAFSISDETAGAYRFNINAAGNVGIGNPNPAYLLDVNGTVHITSGNFLHNSAHGDYEVQQLLAGNNGAGTGDAGLYSWISEPGATWTGAGIGRNMRNASSAFPRVNTGLTGQMMRFDEGTGISFTTETAGGTRYNPMYLSGNDMVVNGNVGIGVAPSAKLDVNGNVALNFNQLLLSSSTGSVGTDGNYGVYWHTNGNGTGNWSYGIYRTPGPWTANNYQQLMMRFDTGIVIDGGTMYGRSGTVLQPNGGNVGIGTSTPGSALDIGGGAGYINGNPTYQLFDSGDKVVQVRGANQSVISLLSDENTDGGKIGGMYFGRTLGQGDAWINLIGIRGVQRGGPGSVVNGDLTIQSHTAGELLRVMGDTGNVGIGTANPTQKLAVNGTIRAKEIIVDTGWADYVFENSYRLAPLAEVEQHIKAEKHLPGIPSAQEIADHGVSMGDMQSKLLSKIEELTLHMIQQEKRAQAQEKLMTAQEQEIAALRHEVSELKTGNR